MPLSHHIAIYVIQCPSSSCCYHIVYGSQGLEVKKTSSGLN